MVPKIYLSAGILLTLALIMPLSSASTEISVTTDPECDLIISVLDASQIYLMLESFHVKTDAEGKAVVSTSTSASEIDVGVTVKQNGQTLIPYKRWPENFEEESGFSTDKPVYINLVEGTASQELSVPEEVVAPEPNVTETPEENVTETPEENFSQTISEESAPITGEVVESSTSPISKNIYLIVIGVVAGLGIILFVMNRFGSSFMPSPQSSPTPAVTQPVQQTQVKQAEPSRKSQISSDDSFSVEKLREAEEKIELEEEELEAMKKAEISKMKERLAELNSLKTFKTTKAKTSAIRTAQKALKKLEERKPETFADKSQSDKSDNPKFETY